MNVPNAIETVNLTKCYGRARGVTGLNLTVPAGEFFGFIGPNGAGKSTTIRTLLGFISPTGGSARVLGMDIRTQREEILRAVGYLPSETAFHPGMRVRDVLKLSAGLRGMNCDNRARQLCERLQLDPSRKVDQLSFGNRKKLGVVCALQHNPRLLILDEPTSGLDPLMQREFFRILGEAHADGTTVFLSSHVLSEIQRNCSSAAIIREGRIIACDRVERLTQTSARRVNIHGAVVLDGLSGVRDLHVDHQGATFLYNGDVNALIRVLSKQNISDLTLSEPDLEEIFMHYYKEGGAEA